MFSKFSKILKTLVQLILNSTRPYVITYTKRILFYPFSPSVHTNTIENEGVCLRKRRCSKTLSRAWTGENGGFRKRLRHWHWHVLVKKNKTDVFLSVFGGQVWTVENAAKTLVWTKNFLFIFKKQKTEVFENALVWTGPYSIRHSVQTYSPECIEQKTLFVRCVSTSPMR